MALTKISSEVIEIKVEGLDGVEKAYVKVDELQRGLEKSTLKSDKAWSGFSKTLRDVEAAGQVLRMGFAALKKGIDAIKAPVGFAVEFERGFASVTTLLDDTGDGFNNLRNGLQQLAKEVPQSMSDITTGAYQAISAGVSEGDAVDFLRVASQAAVAGQSSITEAVQALTAATNAWKSSSLTAGDASDVLFTTVKKGVTTFGELGSVMTQAASLAPMGVSFEEFGAMVATITKQTGGNTAEAMTKITSLIKALGNEATPTAKKLKQLGVDVGIARIRNEGLSAVLADVQKATGGYAEVLGSLSMRKETNAALLMLLGENYSDLTKMIETNRQATGATAEAYGKMAATTGASIDMFERLKEGVLRDLGERVLPMVNEALQRLSLFLQENGERLGAAFKQAAEVLYGLGEWVVRNAKTISVMVGGLFATRLALSFVSAIKAVTVAIGAMGGAGAGIGATLTAALGAPAMIAGAVAAGALLGDAIGTAIGENMTEQVEQRGKELERVVKAQAKRLDSMLKGRGATSMADLGKQEAAFRRGQTLVPGAAVSATGGMVGNFGGALTAAEAVARYGKEEALDLAAANDMVREELAQTSAERASLAKQMAQQAKREFQQERKVLAKLEAQVRGQRSAGGAAAMAGRLEEQRALVSTLADGVASQEILWDQAENAAAEYSKGAVSSVQAVQRAIEEASKPKAAVPRIPTKKKKGKKSEISEQDWIIAQMGGWDSSLMPDSSEAHSQKIAGATGKALGERDKQLKKKAEERADTERAVQVRLMEVREDFVGIALSQEQHRFAEESDKFKGFADHRQELEKAHQDELARIREEARMADAQATAQRIQEVTDTAAAVTRSVSSMISSFGNLANARARSAQTQLKAGKITQAQYEKEVKAAHKWEETQIIAQGILHGFLGGSEAAKAYGAYATGNVPKGVAHTAASIAHFTQAALAPQMARYARDANSAGLAAAGVSGGGGGGGGGMGYSGANTGAPTDGLTERGESRPTVQFGDIVLSDVPHLFGDDGLEALGTRIAGHVAREMNNNGIPGSPRFRRQG